MKHLILMLTVMLGISGYSQKFDFNCANEDPYEISVSTGPTLTIGLDETITIVGSAKTDVGSLTYNWALNKGGAARKFGYGNGGSWNQTDTLIFDPADINSQFENSNLEEPFFISGSDYPLTFQVSNDGGETYIGYQIIVTIE